MPLQTKCTMMENQQLKRTELMLKLYKGKKQTFMETQNECTNYQGLYVITVQQI